MKKLNKYLLTFALIVSFAVIASGQDFYPGRGDQTELNDRVMRQVVGRILVRMFPPQRAPKTVDILDNGIDRTWLPFIKNVRFRLVSPGKRSGDVYFFRKPETGKRTHNIGFGYGDPECNATGDLWSFRLNGQKVRMWLEGGFGSGCGQASGSGGWSEK